MGVAVPLLPPLLSVAWLATAPQREAEPNAERNTPEFLSLPRELAERESDPLSGWALLGREQEKDPVEEEFLLPAEEAVEIFPAPRHLEVRGRLFEEQQPLYCIYDVSSSNWHRLMPGEIDREGGLALVHGRRNRLLLHDRRFDRLYELVEDPLRLLPLPAGGPEAK